MFHCIRLCLLLLLSLGVSRGAPAGCSETGSVADCDFATWSPSLTTASFSTAPCYITVNNINGNLPANAFSGLTDCGDPSAQKSIVLVCTNGSPLVIATNAFAGSLSWITELIITNCVISAGLSAADLSGLSGLTDFTTSGGSIASFAANTFSGLTLNSIAMSSTTLTAGNFPSGLLTNAGSAMTKATFDTIGLTSIPSGAFSGKAAVTSLNIANNQLTTLPSNMLDSMVSLATLSILGNQWDCSCDMSYLVRWIRYTGVVTDGNFVCTTPAAYNGKTLNHVTFALGCEAETTTTADTESTLDTALKYGSAAVATVALVTAIAALICHCCLMQKMATAGSGARPPNTETTPNTKRRRAISPMPNGSTRAYF